MINTQLLWSVAMLSIAALLVTSGYLLRRKAREQSAWIQVPATVVASRAEMGGGWVPYIEYEYVHEGRRLHSLEVYTLQVSRFLRDSLRDVIAKYPVGAAVTAFVDPKNPDKAVLEPGGDPHHVPFM